jgi:hypothetical protein
MPAVYYARPSEEVVRRPTGGKLTLKAPVTCQAAAKDRSGKVIANPGGRRLNRKMVASTREKEKMSDEASEPVSSKVASALPVTAAPSQNVRVELSSAGQSTTYSNFFRVTGTFEELVIDFGLHTGAILPSGPEPVKLTQRMVLSFPTAKRLLAALQVAVSRHEQVFGPIEVDPNKKAKRSTKLSE